MPSKNSSSWQIVALLCLLAFLFVLPVHADPGSRVVISQVYGGGGNSGATYKNDFIELFNAGTADQDLTGWSVQYASATGSGTWANITTLSGTIAAGHYFLIQEAAGTGGTTSLPTPDATGTLALSGTAGKVALVNVSAGLTACTGATIVDFVGFGPTANCSETSPTAVLSNLTAAIRTNVCVDANNNNTEFSVGAPTPRNSSSPTTTCAGPTSLTGTGLATPASVDIASTTLLTVTVTRGTSPTSTGITVVADLAAIGGSATQSFFDDATNGDAVAGDSIFSFDATVAAGTSLGAKSLTASIADTQARSATATINLTVTTPSVFLPIHQIRLQSDSLMGYPVETSGIVTGRRSNGFYLQEKNGTYDGTSLAIFIYTGSTLPAQALVGNELDIAGTLTQYPLAITPTELEITSPVVKSTLSTGNELPTPIQVVPDSTLLQASQFEQYTGMLAEMADTKVVGPTSSGALYVTNSAMPRPFREPGVQAGVTLPDGSPSSIPTYDGNPEVVRVDMGGCTIKPDLAVGDDTGTIVAPLGYYYSSTYGGSYSLFGCPTATTTTKTAVPVSAPLENEFTVASFNMWNFTASTTQLAKASLEIVNMLHTPDIIGVEEVANATALQAVADKVNSDAVAAGKNNPNYRAQLGAVSGTQNIGFLYRADHVTDPTFTVLANGNTMAAPCVSYTLWDRQPFQMDATINVPGTKPFPVTVVVNHMRSLIDVDLVDAPGTVKGNCARLKRGLEAEALATILSGLQSSGKNLITLGDFNAFDFSDGYVDVMGTLIGAPAAADQVVVATQDWIDPNLTDLVVTDPSNPLIYTYVENGSAQSIDHIVVNDSVLALDHRVEVAHINADFPVNFSSDATRPERVSDHDQPIAYFALPTIPVVKPTLTVTVDSVSRIYGADNPTLTGTITGVVAGDNLTVSYSTTAAPDSGIGDYPITATINDPDGKLDDYDVTNTAGTLTITAALLTVKADDLTKVYGADNPTLLGTVTGIQNGDNITATYDTTATVASGVGPHPITATLVDPDNKLVNYTVTNTPGTLTINKKGLAVITDSLSKIYGAANPTLTGDVIGLENSDDISATFATTANNASGVGTYPITATVVDPGDKIGNYSVTNNGGTLTVDKAALAVSVVNALRTYGTANPSFIVAVAGLQNSDNITPVATTTATSASAVGNYPIIVTLLDPDSKLVNYAVTNTPGILTIGQATLTLTPNNKTRVYRDSDPAFDGTLTGVLDGDGITASYSSTASALSNVGTYDISAVLLDPNSKLSSYSVSRTNGTLTITKAALAVTASDATRTFGAANPTFTGIVSMPVGVDSLSSTYSTTATASSPVGTYAIVPEMVDPNGRLGNYTVTLVNGRLTVTPATGVVSLAASVNSVIAGSPVTFTASLAGATGTVTFKDGSTTLGTATFNVSGVATYSVSTFAVGSHGITAVYAGDANFSGSTSNAVAVSVTAFPAPVITSFNQSSIKAGAAAFTLNVYGSNFTATSVVNWAGSARTTTYVSPTELHAAILAADVATVSVSSVNVVNTAPSPGTSNAFKFAIDTAAGGSGAVTVTSVPSVTVTHGLSSTVTFTFTGASADATATAECFNMPTGATCTYNDATKVGTINTAAGTPTGTYPVLVVFTITNTKLTAMQTTGRAILWSFALLPVGFMLMGTGSQRKRRWLILLVLVVVALSLVGCGGTPTSSLKPPAEKVVVQSSVTINVVVN